MREVPGSIPGQTLLFSVLLLFLTMFVYPFLSLSCLLCFCFITIHAIFLLNFLIPFSNLAELVRITGRYRKGDGQQGTDSKPDISSNLLAVDSLDGIIGLNNMLSYIMIPIS
ncbi:hypothetical protein EV127DRAFT_439584 [Xylaria flabelliformis]|nr:hypothetical protein EV127DRAFT_439584 [Xylaria flabelliformis]